MKKRILLLFLFCAVVCAGVWTLVRFTDLRRSRLFHAASDTAAAPISPADAWARAVEKVKEDRGGGIVETPPELRHYSDRYWFLATQVAEIEKYNVPREIVRFPSESR